MGKVPATHALSSTGMVEQNDIDAQFFHVLWGRPGVAEGEKAFKSKSATRNPALEPETAFQHSSY